MGAVIRTSALPKLAYCSHFMGKGGSAGAAAQRGTLADEAFRLANMGKMLGHQVQTGEFYDDPDALNWKCPKTGEDLHEASPLEVLDERVAALGKELGVELKPAREGVEWALAKMREIAGTMPCPRCDGGKRCPYGAEDCPDCAATCDCPNCNENEGGAVQVECITDEERLTVSVEGLDADSVADGNAPAVMEGFDLKSGNLDDYRGQMAGYALGFMLKYFAPSWGMHLLFMDEREVVTHRFTYEEARQYVLGMRAKVLDPDEPRTVNKYCIWCAHADSCPARLEAAQRALEHASGLNIREGFDNIRTPKQLAEFLDAFDALRPFAQVAENRARWLLEDDPDSVRGWALRRVRGIRHVTPSSAIMHTKKLPKGEELTLEKLFNALGNLTPHQFKRILEAVNKPLPKRWSKEGRASTYLMRKAKKT